MNASQAAAELARDEPSSASVYWRETRYELIKLIREPLYPAAVLGFPILFFLIFGLANGNVMFRGHHLSRYLLASYSCFGAIGASLLAVGSGVAVERGYGWLELKRASPMPPAAYLFAKVFAGVLASIIGTLGLFAVAAMTTQLDVSALEVAHLVAANIACALMFAAFGAVLGLVFTPASAPGMMYMVYLPLSLAAGLWLPLESLPHWLRAIAPFLPSYYSAQLSHAALGYEGTVGEPLLWLASFAFGALFVAVGLLIFRRQESSG